LPIEKRGGKRKSPERPKEKQKKGGFGGVKGGKTGLEWEKWAGLVEGGAMPKENGDPKGNSLARQLQGCSKRSIKEPFERVLRNGGGEEELHPAEKGAAEVVKWRKQKKKKKKGG